MDNFSLLCCPRCHGELHSGACTQCQTHYKETLGILDLRWPHPKPMSQAERALLFKLIDNYHKVGFSELVAMRFQNSQLPTDIQQEYEEYAQKPISRSKKMLDMFRKRFIERFSLPEFGVALDIGCGIGASSFLLASQFDQVVGIDVDLISLILARKFLEEQGINNVVLAQAYAQKIPLPEESVHYAVAQNVVEHLFDVKSAFKEVHRVLIKGGGFVADSRNRYDLLWKEPHVKIRWVGFWPRRWQAWYVWRRKRIVYDHAQLLSLPELKRYAQQVFGAQAFVGFPLSTAYGRSPQWDVWIRQLEKTPGLGWLGLFFFPSHLLAAQKQLEPESNNTVTEKEG